MTDHSHPHPHGSVMPPANDYAARLPGDGDSFHLGGFAFVGGEPLASGGVFVLTRRIGSALYPVLIGEAEDMAAAVAQARAEEKVLADGLADGVFWMERGPARMRVHVARELIGKFNPPLNKTHRKGRAAPEIAALISDRAEGLPDERPMEAIEVTEAELDQLVRAFYAQALEDPLIGPVFKRHVSDWDHHFAIVQAFWSRALLGTSRYTGSPFTPHLFMGLKPEFFDRWVGLFRENATKTLRPAAAYAAISRVEHMSVAFQAGLFPLKLNHPENVA